jgi:hypothetical protein
MISLQETLFDLTEYSLECDERKSNHNSMVGTLSEIMFMSEAASHGFHVFMPIGHAQKADCIIWKPQAKPITIQIKKAGAKSINSWQIPTSSKKSSCNANPNDRGSLYTNYTEGDFDILAAHITEQNCWALYRLKDICGQTSIRWTGSPRNNFELLNHI